MFTASPRAEQALAWKSLSADAHPVGDRFNQPFPRDALAFIGPDDPASERR